MLPHKCRGREKNEIQGKEQNKPLFFNHPLLRISNKCLFQRSITSLVESASHLYKYQRDMGLMNSSGINKEPGLQRGAVGAAGTLAEFKGKPAEQAASSGLDPAACSSPTALHLTLTSHHRGPVCVQVKIYSFFFYYSLHTVLYVAHQCAFGFAQCR